MHGPLLPLPLWQQQQGPRKLAAAAQPTPGAPWPAAPLQRWSPQARQPVEERRRCRLAAATAAAQSLPPLRCHTWYATPVQAPTRGPAASSARRRHPSRLPPARRRLRPARSVDTDKEYRWGVGRGTPVSYHSKPLHSSSQGQHVPGGGRRSNGSPAGSGGGGARRPPTALPPLTSAIWAASAMPVGAASWCRAASGGSPSSGAGRSDSMLRPSASGGGTRGLDASWMAGR